MENRMGVSGQSKWRVESGGKALSLSRQSTGALIAHDKNNQKGEVIGRSAMAGWEHATMYEEKIKKDQESSKKLEICSL